MLVRVDSPPHHYRTPAYVQGKKGQVVALCGVFPNPESLAHGGSGGSGLPQVLLYRVEFPQTYYELWAGYQENDGLGFACRHDFGRHLRSLVGTRHPLEVWPESHWSGFGLRQADVLWSYTA